ncbi:hypothetical protein K443DRAFT_686120 [Laccaria amethystina LaAM-08-1]|uniref:Uncharacterized protein n=1 Tax=Laccaria amethystina LaAM-08-1 TaxID=1095629 RepID=A0A0C9X1A8_9AGAR|nr:hypothetical protein K443DRAFT_686120 [Laccaria amethystina LaAM-08-1]
MASTGPTKTQRKHGSFSANNPNFESNLNTPNYVVRDGGLNVGTNSASDADGGRSPSGGMPEQKVSFDGDPGSLYTMGTVDQAVSLRGRDPITALCTSASPSDRHGLNPQRGSADFDLPNIDFDLETAAGPSPGAISDPGTSNSNSSNSSSNGPYNSGNLTKSINDTSIKSFCEAAGLFVSDTLPRQVYHNLLLLRLPAMYSSRVARMAGLEFNSQGRGEGRGGVGVDSASGTPFHGGSGERVYPPGHQGPPGVSGAAPNGFDSWEAFIDSLLREWKTLNVVSAVLTSTILAILQIPEASDDPITRSTALLSFICSLMSLSYGYIYIVRFGTMRSMYRASGWAEEVGRTNTAIWWNVWVLLAMPAVWMSWYYLPLPSLLSYSLTLTLSFFPFLPHRSMLLFLASILAFVWRTGLGNDPSSRAPLSTTAVLGPRVAITGVLGLGLAYLAMIVRTLIRYDREWGEMKRDEEMRIGTILDAISVQGGEPGERGRERRERDGDRGSTYRDRMSTRRRGGGADRHLDKA